MRNIFYRIIGTLVLLLLMALSVGAQTVGLVLSGGGSKGLAHIGVIRALEENNIPIDYVVGTSIGAIVGALYSVGHSPDEIEAIFKDESFVNYYKGRFPENQYYYFKETNKDGSAFSLGIAKKDSMLSIVLPTNLIASQPMDFGVLQYFTQYTAGAGSNFDCLFVPFRCVASDIYNNREVIFREGDLGLSVRASMTFPFYFKPIEIDSILFFDGGIYNNFPIDVMRNEFNPDVIIGVSVTSYSIKPNSDDLFLQIENLIMGEKKEYEVPVSEGVTLHVDFKDVGLLDFHRVDEFVKAGYDGCNNMIDSIKGRVTERTDSADLAYRRAVYQDRLPVLSFDKVYFEGLTDAQENYLNKTFKKKSEKLNLKQLESEYYKLISDYQIEEAIPQAIYNDTTGFFDVHFKIKKQKRVNVKFGAGLSTGNSNQAFFGLNYKMLNSISLLLNSNIYFGRFYSSLHLSGRLDLPTSVPLALEMSANVNRFDYFKGNSRLFSLDFRPSYIVNYDNSYRVDVFTPINRLIIAKLGVSSGFKTYDYFQISNFQQTDTADFTSFFFNTAHFSLERDNHNYKQYANKGTRNIFSFRYINGVESNTPGSTTALIEESERKMTWMQFQILSDSYTKISDFFTIGVYAEMVFTNKPFFSNYSSSILSAPSFDPTPHSRTLIQTNYRANSFIALGLKPIITFTEELNLRFEAYAFMPYEKILKSEPYDRVYRPYYSESLSYLHYMAMAALVYHTPFGPVAISANYYQTESVNTYFMAHFGFILFNKRAFEP